MIEESAQQPAQSAGEVSLAGEESAIDFSSPIESPRSLIWREWILAVVITLSVTVLPGIIVALLLPGSNHFLAAGCAIAISLLIANIESRAWRAWPGSQDLPYKDLTIWGLAARRFSERRLRSARRMYEAAARDGSAIQIERLEELSRLLAAANPYTSNHVRRVAAHAEEVARGLHLPAAEVARIRTAAVVHDIGKLHTPPWILDKPGALTGAELAVMKRHPVEGAAMLEGVGDPELAAIVRHHHERFDGGGYPEGLAGQAIPLGSRIISVADSFDAITSNRPYRPARSQRRALQILVEESGSQFDGEVVEAFLERYSPRRSLAPMAIVAAICQRGWEALPLTLAGGGGAGAALPALGAAGALAVGAPVIHHHTKPPQALAAHGQPMVVMEHAPTHHRHHRSGAPASIHAQTGARAFVNNPQGTVGGLGGGHGSPGRGESTGRHHGSAGPNAGRGPGAGRHVRSLGTPKARHGAQGKDERGSSRSHHQGDSGPGADEHSQQPGGSAPSGTKASPKTDSSNQAPGTSTPPTETHGTWTAPTPSTTPMPTTTSPTPSGEDPTPRTPAVIPPAAPEIRPTPTAAEAAGQEAEEFRKLNEELLERHHETAAEALEAHAAEEEATAVKRHEEAAAKLAEEAAAKLAEEAAAKQAEEAAAKRAEEAARGTAHEGSEH